MKDLNKIIGEDVKAAFAAFKDDSFDNVNIFGNRIMSNAIFGENNKTFLPGYFVKDVGLTFLLLKVRESAMAFSTAKSYGFTFVERLVKSAGAYNEEEMWQNFLEYNEKIRKFKITPWEEKNYTDDKEFTKDAFKWLLNYLSTHKETLSNPMNNLIKGTLNEMDRVSKIHGFTLQELMVMHLLIALDRNNDYVSRFVNEPEPKTFYQKQMKELIKPNLEKIISLGNKNFTIQEADELLWTLVKSWRQFFLEFGEIVSSSIAVQKGIELPEDLKKKVTESITKSVQKEI